MNILSARYADPAHESVIVTTQQRGDVVVTEARHAQWQILQAWIGRGNTVAAYPLQSLRDAKKQAIAARFDAAVEAGMAYGGKVLQIREMDRGNIDTMGTKALFAVAFSQPWIPNFAWRMADDTDLPIATAQDMVALADAAMQEFHRLLKVKWAHVNAVAALNTAQAIRAYDIETGWNKGE